tara:strand:+ start:32784 stop:33296 length:513 start_codon:yes stop_codon:yes gene_type:complete
MIYDLKSWKDIEIFANQHNLFDNKTHWLLDIDDTLIETTQYIGSTKWFDSEIKHNPGNEHIIINIWSNMVKYLQFKLIDSNIPNILNKIKGNISALTSRNSFVKTETYNTLQKLELRRIKIIQFCGSNKKYNMVNIEKNMNYVFIDDKYSHILSMNNKFPNIHCIWFNPK